MEELLGEMQSAMTSVVAKFKEEIRALQASETAKDDELKAEVEACKAEV